MKPPWKEISNDEYVREVVQAPNRFEPLEILKGHGQVLGCLYVRLGHDPIWLPGVSLADFQTPKQNPVTKQETPQGLLGLKEWVELLETCTTQVKARWPSIVISSDERGLHLKCGDCTGTVQLAFTKGRHTMHPRARVESGAALVQPLDEAEQTLAEYRVLLEALRSCIEYFGQIEVQS